MGSETLPSACYILSDEFSIPFYSTSNEYKKYVSTHIQLTPHFNIEADIDCSTDALEEVFVEPATISTPQGRDVQTNHFKRNLQIERKRGAFDVPGKPTDRRHQNNVLHTKSSSKKTENAQLRYSHNTISRSTQCYPCSSIWLSSKPWNNRTSKQNNIRNTHSI